MKNNITFLNNNINSSQLILKKKSELSKNEKNIETLPNKPPNFNLNLLLKSSDYLQRRKEIFRPEKIKLKENIFKSFKEVPKKQIKKEKENIQKAKAHLLHSLAILKDTNLDEGIVLNKYFLYLKKSGVEYKEYMKMKLQSMLKPIKAKENEIKNLKKNINFYKSISNQMLLKYMLESKDKLYEFMKEKFKEGNNGYDSCRNNSHSYKTRNLTYLSDKSNSRTSKSTCYNAKNIFLTNANNNNNTQKNKYLRKQLLDKNKVKKIIPKIPELKLKEEENDLFITSYSRNKNNNIKQGNKNLGKANTYSSNSYISIKKSYLTPQTTQRKKSSYILNLNSEKSNKKTNYSSRRSYKMKNYNINNIFHKIKIKGLNLNHE